ncbi:hypothetical protein ACPV5J_19095 [Vibrio rotiferianus]|uniref:hypothetical protein n=1 Tax=Vibrio rotiferianus TaxID=190895 RepID=UPI00406A5FB2
MDDLELLNEAANDNEWGDFGSAIKQLEQQESASQDDAITPTVETDSNESLEILLSSVFNLTEQAISAVNDIEFCFDDKGKTEVIQASVPVLKKYGAVALEGFQYLEEATLALAVLGLVVSTRLAIKGAKAQKQIEEQPGGEDGEKEAA